MRHAFADVAHFQRDFLGFVQARAAMSDAPVQRLRLGFAPVWLVSQPEFIKDILKASEDVIDKGRLIHKLKPIVGNSLLVMSGPEHRRRRGALHGLLAKGGAAKYVPQIAALVRKQAARLAYDGTVFNAHELSARLALRIICLITFGGNVLTEADENAIVYAVRLAEDDLADEIFQLFPSMPWTSARKRERRREALAMMDAVVGHILNRASADSVVSILKGLNLSQQDIRDEILTLLLAGHTTTGNATTWILYYLATQPGLADSIREEAFAASGDGGDLEPGRLSGAKLSYGLIRETLRLWPSSHWFSRDVKSDVAIGGHQLRRGETIIISPWQMHRDPRFWERADDFDIGRDFGQPSYIPFGAGPRACLGMGVAMLEMQVIALELASSFQIKLKGGAKVGRPKPSVTLVPPKMEMTFVVRDTNIGSDKMRAA